MMRSILALSILGIVLTAGHASAQFREFKSQDGKPLKARITKFDPKRDRLTLKLENGRTVTVKPDIFSDADQIYIRDWPTINAFLSNERFRINIDDPVLMNEWNRELHRPVFGEQQHTDKTKIVDRKYKKYSYQLRLMNQSDYAYSNITVKACAFYNQEYLDLTVEEVVSELKVIPKMFVIDGVGPKSPYKFISQPVVIINKELRSVNSRSKLLDYFSEERGRYQRGNLIGIIVRFYWTAPGGEEIEREIRYPKELSSDFNNKWIEPTGEEIEVVYNEVSDDGIPDAVETDDDDDDDDDGDDDGDN